MKGMLKASLPFAVVVVIALWWVGALDWRAANVNEPPQPKTAQVPDVALASDEP